MFSNDETVIVLVNTGVMVTSFLLGNIFFHFTLLSWFLFLVSTSPPLEKTLSWGTEEARIYEYLTAKAPIYPLIHDISGVFVSKLLDTQQKPHQGIKNKTQT